MFGFLYSRFLVLIGLWISWTITQTLSNLRLPISFAHMLIHSSFHPSLPACPSPSRYASSVESRTSSPLPCCCCCWLRRPRFWPSLPREDHWHWNTVWIYRQIFETLKCYSSLLELDPNRKLCSKIGLLLWVWETIGFKWIWYTPKHNLKLTHK